MVTETLTTSAAVTPTDKQMYEWRARRLLADLADYEYLAAEVRRCKDRITESLVRESGCTAIRYDRVIAGRNIGGERPIIDHEAAITKRSEIERELETAQARIDAVNDMLNALDDRTRAMAIDKYVTAEFDVIMEERYGMTRCGIRRRILNAVANYCKNCDQMLH